MGVRLAAEMSNSEQAEISEQAVTAEAAEAAANVNGDGAASEDPAPDTPAIEELQLALQNTEKERDEMLDKLQRAQADFENIRKRLQREKEDVVRYAASGIIESLLSIVDDFDRAIGAEGVTPQVKQGLELIHRRIFEVFSRAGLKEIVQHETFDPNLHYAVDRAPATDEQVHDQILEVYQKGYFFKDRLLRASMVKVAIEE